MTGMLHVVVGGQFGSEAKGHVAGYLAKAAPGRTIGVRVAGPNAGHTAYDERGKAWALRQVPVAVVTREDAGLVIAAGSEIDLGVLGDEIDKLEKAGHKTASRLLIDGAATVLTEGHQVRERERDLTRKVGSTAKGIGAARSDRIWREAKTAWDLREEIHKRWPDVDVSQPGVSGVALTQLLQYGLSDVVIEGTQGYGLGLHTKYYPQVTSSDCRAIDFLAMAGISPWAIAPERLAVWVVFRPYPIRVAGNSGPLHGETTWKDLGLPEERTTVTKKTRRVGQWDTSLAHDAVRANGGGFGDGVVRAVFAMADQVVPEIAGKTEWVTLPDGSLAKWLDLIELAGAPVRLVLTGPDTEMVVAE